MNEWRNDTLIANLLLHIFEIQGHLFCYFTLKFRGSWDPSTQPTR